MYVFLTYKMLYSFVPFSVTAKMSCNHNKVTGSLSLPVEPHSAGTVVNHIATVDAVNCCMHFNSANFAACKILLVIYVMNMTVFNKRENSTQMSNNSSLTAIMNITAADYM